MSEQEDAIEKVAQAFANLGANTEQSIIMAKQLVKRADQLSKEKNTSWWRSWESFCLLYPMVPKDA